MIEKIIKLVKNNIVLLLVLLIPFLAGFNLLNFGYFSMHDDVQIMRLYEMEKCLRDGQIPCRWVPDMGAGYGHPLFNYHPVFPYYFGMLFRLFGLSFLFTGKLLFFFSLLLSGLSMYLLGKEFFGKLGGLVSSVLYVFAPYRAVDIYVRGALTESYAFVFFPLIFLFIYGYIKKPKISSFALSIFSLAGLFLTHNLMPLIFIPIAFFWGIYWIIHFKKSWSFVLKYLSIFIWALGLSAFFVIPSVLEMNLARLDLMTINNYVFKNHFVGFSQLFVDRTWGYGPSIPGFNDDLSLQIGWPHWVLGLISLGAYGFLVIKKQKHDRYPLVLAAFFFLSLLMSLDISLGVWEMIPLINYIQFPWRFLSVMIFVLSFLAGWLLSFGPGKKHSGLLTILIIIITLILNLNYFKSQIVDTKMTDAVKLSGWEREKQSRTTLEDYVPKTVKLLPISMAPKEPTIVVGRGIITEYQRRSDFFRFAVETQGEEGVVVEVPIFDFPIWEVFLNTTKTNHQVDPDKGTILVAVNPDKHTVVTGWFRNTPIRKVANGITILSFGVLVVLIILKSKENGQE